MTPEEEIIAECLQREQVEGMEGFDSGDQSLRSGKCVLAPIRCVACEGVEGNM